MIGASEMQEIEEHQEKIDRTIYDTINNLNFLLSLTEGDFSNRVNELDELLGLADELSFMLVTSPFTGGRDG